VNLIMYLCRNSWRKLLFATVFSIIAGAGGAALVAVVAKALSGPANVGSAWYFFGLCLLTLVCRATAEISLMRLTQTGMLRLRVALSHKLLATPYKQLQTLGKNGLYVILTRDVDTCIQMFPLIPGVICNIIIIVSCTGYLAWLSWPICLVFICFAGIGMPAFHRAQQIPRRQMTQVRESAETLSGHLLNMINGSKELQLNRQRGTLFVDQVVAPAAQQFRNWFVRCMTNYAWVGHAGGTLFYVALGSLIFIVPAWIPQQREVLTSTTLVLLYVIGPMTELLGAVPAVHEASVSLKKIEQLDTSLRGIAPPPADPSPFINGAGLHLTLRGVCHRYPGEIEDQQFMLGPVDLELRQGEILFITGGNGSGKSTLAMLLLGLYEPEAGDILLNGQAVTPTRRECYRQHFSAVFADFHLFEQLLGADRESQEQRARHYLKSMGMEHKVKIKNGVFSTLALSTGQRKRLALIASYLEDRPIYVFDEWAADQDPMFKRVFYTELLPELKARGKAVVVISHDDAYFGTADRILKLEDGRVRELEVQTARYA
jgi:putative ATP-binding cassette transporter